MVSLCRFVNIEPPSLLRWLPATQPDSKGFLDVLHKGRNCSATDPRGKVYALLGLVHQSIADAISVDYSLTPTEVFTRVATYFLTTRQSLAVLRHAMGGEANTIVEPTWAPRWDCKGSYDLRRRQFTSSDIADLALTWFVPVTTDEDGLPDLTKREYREGLLPLEIREREDRSDSPSGPAYGNLQKNASLPPCLRIRAHYLDKIVRLLPSHSGSVYAVFLRDLCPAIHYSGLCSACTLHRNPALDHPIPVCPKGPERLDKQKQAFLKDAHRLR